MNFSVTNTNSKVTKTREAKKKLAIKRCKQVTTILAIFQCSLKKILSVIFNCKYEHTHIIVHSEKLISMCQIYRNKTATKKKQKSKNNIARPKSIQSQFEETKKKKQINIISKILQCVSPNNHY